MMIVIHTAIVRAVSKLLALSKKTSMRSGRGFLPQGLSLSEITTGEW